MIRATRDQTYYILVWIHENVEIVLLGDTKNSDGEIDPMLIVDFRTSVFNCLPSEDISNGVVSPFSETLEMYVGIFQGERPSHERYVLFEELLEVV